MANINEAFNFVVPKYDYQSNRVMIVTENQWQIQDYMKPRGPPRNTIKCPASGNSAQGRDITYDPSLLSGGPDPNLGSSCTTMDTCNNVREKLLRRR